jgi:hypothetical protein
MITIGEAIHALQGIGRLVRFDRGGLTYFDRSIQGFWRSFGVAFLVAPPYALLIPQRLEMIKPTIGWAEIMTVQILFYIVGWFLYPVVAFELCRWLKRPSEYPGYIVVYNWSAVPFVLMQLALWLPALSGTASAETSEMLVTIWYYVFQVYLWFVAREALRIDGLTAVALVFADHVLTRILSAAYVATLTP